MTVFTKIWAKKNYRIATALGGLIIVWLASGLLVGSEQPEDAAVVQQKTLTSVMVKDMQASDYPVTLSLRARTEPNRAVEVKAEIVGRVIALPVEKGGLVNTGDVICELAAEDRIEMLDQAKAVLTKAQLDYDGALRLKSGGYQSRTAIADALARLEAAKASATRAQLNRDNLFIKAPFAGVVDVRPVEQGDFMQRGDVCAKVLDLDPLLVSGRLAESSVAKIKVGDQVGAALASGEKLQGTVRFIERNSDLVTRTFRLEALVDNAALTLRSGLTAEMTIPVGTARAHLVNASLLVLDDEGGIGLKIIDDQDVVHFVNVQIIGDQSDGVWVTGLPETNRLITIGQQYVVSGEHVITQSENSGVSKL